MAEHEKRPLLSSSDSEEYGRKFRTFPRNNVQIQEGPTGARFDATATIDTTLPYTILYSIYAATPKRRYRCDNFLPCDPRRNMHRFLMLILMCLLSFGEGGKMRHHNKLNFLYMLKYIQSYTSSHEIIHVYIAVLGPLHRFACSE